MNLKYYCDTKICRSNRGPQIVEYLLLHMLVTSLVLGHKPEKFSIDQTLMRKHLLQCLESKFPSMSRTSKEDKIAYLNFFCLCRMPEDKAVNWIECSVCNEWYHVGTCVEVSSHFMETSREWHCP